MSVLHVFGLSNGFQRIRSGFRTPGPRLWDYGVFDESLGLQA